MKALRRRVPQRTYASITVAVLAFAAAAIVSMRGGGETAPKPYDIADVIEVVKTAGPYTVHTDRDREWPAEFLDGYRASAEGSGFGGQSAHVYEDATTAAAVVKALAKVSSAREEAWTTKVTEPQWLAPAEAKKSWEAHKKLLARREKSFAANARKPKWPSIARCANVVVVTGWVDKAQQTCAELAKSP